ncbi:threonine aldolase family protein [Ramlibacter sp.]|uniref:threonine aldolase family protein n=1 Tax=Ramlibacter sp. TaxID=1917967 RepID=UPI003D0CC2C8
MQRFPLDFYSDTKTQPTPAMRRVMADAEVGDEQHREDPTVARLLERVADLLGAESAIFVPSGTMANAVAVLVHCRPGDEVIAHESAHLFHYEAGGLAALAGAMPRPVGGARGLFDVAAVRAAMRHAVRPDLPTTRLVALEQTANLGGGAVWPLAQLAAVTHFAREAGFATHLDGARLFNASTASGVAPREYARCFDTVYVDFTKGLGAPFGAVLAGTRPLIEAAWRWKQRLGGSMRQAGVLAAACLHALDHHVERLAEDHANARELARLLADVEGIAVEPVETNMVFIDVAATGLSAQAFNDALAPDGIRMSPQGATRLRAVTHLDIRVDDVIACARAVRRIAADRRGTPPAGDSRP